MKRFAFRALVAVAMLAVAAPLLAQTMATSTVTGKVTAEGAPLPGVRVIATSPKLQGPRGTVTDAQGAYLIPFLPPGDYTVTFEMDKMQTREEKLTLTGDMTDTLNVELQLAAVAGEDRRHRGEGDDGDDRGNVGQRELQAGSDQRASDRPDLRGGHAARSGRQRRRAERQHRHLRRDVVRQPVPGQRSDRQREPARPAARSLHRGRDRGDDRPDRRHLGRVRPLHRRRRQHAHQVGRQRVHGEPPQHAEKRELDGPDAADGRAGGHDQPDLRGHLRRADLARPAVVLHRGSVSRHERHRPDRTRPRPYRRPGCSRQLARIRHTGHAHHLPDHQRGNQAGGQADLGHHAEPQGHRLLRRHRRVERPTPTSGSSWISAA